MIETFRFGRLDSRSKLERYRYDIHIGKDAQWSPQHLTMEEPGAHWSVTIKNYMREDIFVVNSLRTPVQRIAPIYVNARAIMMDTSNVVFVNMRKRENNVDSNGNIVTVSTKRIEISCPGHLLEKASLFVEDLGAYIALESRLVATRAMIAEDAKNPNNTDISAPSSALPPNPKILFREYEALLRNCVERSDLTRVRVGVHLDKNPDRIPDYVKSLRIAIMDESFSPYFANRIVYDPNLGYDEILVENLHAAFSDPIKFTFTQLYGAEGRALFIDTDLHDTYAGRVCGMAIFADQDAFIDYLHEHKSMELYDQLAQRLADTNGNYALKRQIEKLYKDIADYHTKIEDLENLLKTERSSAKEVRRLLDVRETTIRNLTDNKESALSFDAIRAELDNERRKLELEAERIAFEKQELKTKASASKTAHRAGMLKSIADMAKSTWGILTLSGSVLAIYLKWRTNK